MHEVSLAVALIDLVQEHAAAAQAGRVTRLVIEVGTLSHVDAHAFRFAIDAAALGGVAEGATLEIRGAAWPAYCLDCEASLTISARGARAPLRRSETFGSGWRRAAAQGDGGSLMCSVCGCGHGETHVDDLHLTTLAHEDNGERMR